MPTEQIREMTEHQMIEYATRMRAQRDRYRKALERIRDGQTKATTHEQAALNYRRIAREVLDGA